MSNYEEIDLSIDEILLDLKNPRHDVVVGQREAIIQMAKVQKDKLYRLAKDIIENGLNPTDIPLVIPYEKDKSKFIVVEGNRRITAIKLLITPQILEKSDTKLASKFKVLGRKLDIKQIEPFKCIAFKSRRASGKWVELKHTGENNGIGTVTWGATEQARYLERQGKKNTALQAIEFVNKHGDLKDISKEQLEKIRITNLVRLLGDKDVQEFLGIKIQDGKIVSVLTKDEVLKGLQRIIVDLAIKKIKVGDIYLKDNRKEYIEGFERQHRPNPTKIVAKPWNLDSRKIPEKTVSHKKVRTLSKDRKYLIPTSCKLSINEPRINDIYIELKNHLVVDSTKNAVAVLYRVFIEFSVEAFLEKHQLKKISTTDPLYKKLKKIAEYMEADQLLSEDELKPVFVASSLDNKHSLFSTNTFNAFVHNKKYNPIPSELKSTWDNFQPFIEKLWDMVGE